jgi:lysozyme
MRTSDNGIKFIKHFEGVRFKPYRDVIGLWTVGAGHLIEGGKQLPDSWNRTFTEREVDALLRHDLLRFEAGLSRLLPNVHFRQNEYDALISFVFNLGLGTLQRSTLRQSLLRNDKLQASKAFLKYIYAGGKVVEGLKKRRLAEQQLFLSV